ncbi:MAG: site-specific integrase, partial [Deltaproteobacteria bacterium]|nr:site-specific integrase [Deltaproteobacteria bacterium]
MKDYSENQLLDQFIHQMRVERGLSTNTIVAYSHDLIRFFDFLKQKGVSPVHVSQEDLISFIVEQNMKLSPRSMARCLVSIRMFYRFLVSEGSIESNPARLLGAPKMYQHLPDVLTRDEMEALLSQPDIKTALGKRDKAIVEILYATGLRVSELIGLAMHNINLEVGAIRTIGKGSKERI